eukprot:12922465-Alexandrium_andersonii.AAC.1
MASRHSWEVDEPFEEASSGEEYEEFDYSRATPEIAGEELANFLLQLKHSGVLSAKSCCLLAWWAARAGAVGP